mgnify:CR=1 FL=1
MFALSYIGILPLFFDLVQTTGTYEEKILYTMIYFGASWSIIGFLAGFAFSKTVLGLKLRPLPSETHPLCKGDIPGLTALLCLSLIVLLLYLSKIERIALIVALRDSISESKVARSAMGNAFPGKYHWYRLFFSQVLSFVTFAFWSNWLVTKRKKRYFFSCFPSRSPLLLH